MQVVETLLCLHAGTKISSRAQGIGAVACRWHAIVTCKSLDGGKRSMSLGSLSSSFSESESCLLDENAIVCHSQFASVSSYNKRQSFGKFSSSLLLNHGFLSYVSCKFGERVVRLNLFSICLPSLVA